MRGDRKKEDTSRVHGAAGSNLGGAVAGAVMGTTVGTPVVGTIIGAVSGAVIGARKKRVHLPHKGSLHQSKGIDEKKAPCSKAQPEQTEIFAKTKNCGGVQELKTQSRTKAKTLSLRGGELFFEANGDIYAFAKGASDCNPTPLGPRGLNRAPTEAGAKELCVALRSFDPIRTGSV